MEVLDDRHDDRHDVASDRDRPAMPGGAPGARPAAGGPQGNTVKQTRAAATAAMSNIKAAAAAIKAAPGVGERVARAGPLQ
ncbi:hypothetical protein MNEG_3385, partial [Monoraphidium neglectum]